MSDAHLHSELLTQLGLLARIGRETRYRAIHSDLAYCIERDRHRDKITRHQAEARNYKQQGERP